MADEMSDFASTGDYRGSEQGSGALALTCLFLGMAIGAVTALILAPKSGKQMRKALRRRYEDARDVVDDWSDQAGDWIDKGSDWADKAKGRVKPFAKRFRR